ncbi:hypothetical protein DMH17_16735 [Raoultella planticola]|nr:hypothetical protein [Raoultella planticola]
MAARYSKKFPAAVCVASTACRCRLEYPAAPAGKPDRLLIEPTGLGHPKQILDISDRRRLRAVDRFAPLPCVCRSPPAADSKVMANANLRDQLAAADVIISNKRTG